ncbi:MAG: tetratricopeptide repeat protein [bacterium]|nr:tetratricopeptide repeat protein [bacterium]
MITRTQSILTLTLLTTAIIVLTFQPANAQPSATSDSLFAQANALLQQEKWSEAAAAFERVTKIDTTNTQAIFQLGQSYYLMNEFKKAAAAWERADARNYRPATTRYNIASSYAQLYDKENAFIWLAQALEAGFNRTDILGNDKVLDTLRSDDRFAKVLEVADQNARPCEYDPVYRILDFWLGEWDVFANENQKIGVSFIRKMVNGCAIQENFEQLDGFVGQNLFYFNNVTGEWKMIWVTGAATSLGGVKEKVMNARDDSGTVRFQGTLPDNTAGQLILDRSTFAPVSKDRVNMTIQQSRDGGDNWVTTFSGYYQRREK